jgi:hypothetical protein
MKILAWLLCIMGIFTNIDTIWKILESTDLANKINTTTSVISLVVSIFVMQKFPEDKKLVMLSKIAIIIFLITILVVLWNRFLR